MGRLPRFVCRERPNGDRARTHAIRTSQRLCAVSDRSARPDPVQGPGPEGAAGDPASQDAGLLRASDATSVVMQRAASLRDVALQEQEGVLAQRRIARHAAFTRPNVYRLALDAAYDRRFVLAKLPKDHRVLGKRREW